MAGDPFPPPKSPNTIFLVTGVNGLIASHVADQLLAAGYRVRGTVRDISRCEWLTQLFEARYGCNRFGLVQLNDFGAEGAWEVALQGVSGVASVASPTYLEVDDVDCTVAAELKWFYALLSAAKKTSSVKSFSFTSSIWAAYTPNPNVPGVVTENTWNDEAVARAADRTLTADEKGLAPFMAVKVKVEKGCWEWIEREKPRFTFNAILADTVLGPILAPEFQQGSTSGMLLRLFEGKDYEIIHKILPQWFVDSRDTGRLHLVALTDSSVDRQRLFACAERYSWFQIVALMRQLYPDRIFVELEDQGWDQTEMPNTKAGELLRRIGRTGWVPLEESVRENIECYYRPA
ncbi:hypothetical protein jhhlp_005763 [Lomentospora prolificans]|uniref:NAD-dependent epimerase/dehydratase domain-containing protein n=1 Tax=Lomentospora prolificans TaxID=41688 RepID=A0A2N3N406_9PEZI|nr:hypothetical protein jhhlp_005763 [Lomentospora prolificans]